MKTSALMLIALHTVSLAYAQNLIRDSQFEQPGTGFPYAQSHMHEMKHWEHNLGQGTQQFHSVDWFYHDKFWVTESINGPGNMDEILGNQGSPGYIGMRSCEMAQQEMQQPLTKSEWYYVSFFFRIPATMNATDGGDNFGPYEVGLPTDVEVNFSKAGTKYENPFSDCTDGEDCYELNAIGNFATKQTLPLIHIDPSQYRPGKWYRKVSAPFMANKAYDWISFQTKVDQRELCDSYILFDDFVVAQCNTIGESCPASCDFATGPITITSNGTNSQTNPLTLFGTSNVTSMSVSIYAQTGQEVYNTSLDCPNGWDQDLVALSLPVLAQGNYLVRVAAGNDCNSCLVTFQMAYDSHYAGQIAPCPCRADGLPKACCASSLEAEQLVVTCQQGPFEISAIDHLSVGVNQPFVVPTNADIRFSAGQSVTLGAGFNSANGSFTATVENCNSQKMATSAASQHLPQAKDLLQLYPNPASNQVHIINRSANASSVRIVDVSGRLIDTLMLDPGQLQTVNTEYLSKGVYLVVLHCEAGSTTKRLVIN